MFLFSVITLAAVQPELILLVQLLSTDEWALRSGALKEHVQRARELGDQKSK